MKPRLVLSLIAALVSGGLSQLYFLRLEADVSGGPRVPVLVAATDVPVGAVLTESTVVVRDVPQAYVEARQIRATEVKKVIGIRAAAGLKANETILWSDLAPLGDHRRVLSGLIESGMRAVNVDGRTANFDGLLRSGDRVDVLLTTGDKGDGDGKTITLLQNLLVLAVGGLIGGSAQDAKSVGRGTSVSLSATIEQAQRLTLATDQGRLTVTLRNPEDILLVDDVPATTSNDFEPHGLRIASERGVAAPRGHVEHVR